MGSRFGAYVSAAVGLIAGLITIIGAIWGPIAEGLGGMGVGWQIGLGVLGIILLTVGTQLWSSASARRLRERRYSELPLHFLEMLKSANANGGLGPGNIKEGLATLLVLLARALSGISGQEVRACIKVLEPVDSEDPNQPSVVTLARDRPSKYDEWAERRRDFHHWVAENTDFHQLHEQAGMKAGERFFENRLPYLWPYRNTSFELVDEHPPQPDSWPDFLRPIALRWRDRKWPLVYKSTLVVPIMEREEPGSDTRPDLFGYLAVDSPAMGAFDDKRDTAVLQTVAQMIVPRLETWRNEKISEQKAVKGGEERPLLPPGGENEPDD